MPQRGDARFHRRAVRPDLPQERAVRREAVQNRLQIAVILCERHDQPVRLRLGQRLPEMRVCRCPVVKPGIGRRQLDQQVQPHQCVVQRLARRKQCLCLCHRPPPRALRQPHLRFHHAQHRLRHVQHPRIRERVLRETWRDLLLRAAQRRIVSPRRVKGQQQRRVPPGQQRCPCFGGVRRLRAARRSQMQPQRQHRAALQDIRLPALLRAVTRPLQRRLRLSEPPL